MARPFLLQCLGFGSPEETKAAIIRSVAMHGGGQDRAAEALGVSQSALSIAIRHYDLKEKLPGLIRRHDRGACRPLGHVYRQEDKQKWRHGCQECKRHRRLTRKYSSSFSLYD